ncbi:MAG: hypothetical protein M8840_05435, partial [marine benthic group bacterium]|nr:hypothetical protein [Gemmatimonadota bacterium]
ICIELRQGDESPEGEFDHVRKVIQGAPGPGPVMIRWKPGGRNGAEPPLLTSKSLRVAPSAAVLAELRTLLGRERVHLIRGRGQ